MRPDTWTLDEAEFSTEQIPQNETLFALSNGYLGIRDLVFSLLKKLAVRIV